MRAAVVSRIAQRGIRCSVWGQRAHSTALRPAVIRRHTAVAAFDDGDNCITDATTRSIVAAAGGGGSGGGGKAGGGGGSGSGGQGGAGDGQPAHPMRLFTFLFAGLLAVGGAMAYARKGSVQSLGAGLGAALLLAACANAMVGAGAGPQVAARAAFGISLLLGVVMAKRFSDSRKVMPAGLVAGCSASMCIGFLCSGL